MLKFFKFPPSISKLIIHCVTTSNIAVLVNGSVTSFFRPSRGIRQGCPMSPYLFILYMEIFSRLICHQVDTHNWDPIYLSPNNQGISHLFFADDLTLMGKVNKKSDNTIKRIFSFFCSLSGQKHQLPQIKNNLL